MILEKPIYCQDDEDNEPELNPVQRHFRQLEFEAKLCGKTMQTYLK
jgi:hypothetical protein